LTQLTHHIEELLYTNDCVIIPNVGGFIVNYNAAEVDFINHQLHPPKRTVSFNPKLVTNDGLLANHLVQKKHIKYNQAIQEIEAFSFQLEQDLFNKKIVHFPKVGKLYFNADSKLEFAPASTNFSLDSYGFLPLDCNPILRNKAYLNKETTTSKNTDTAITPKRGKKTAAIYQIITLPRVVGAASIILLLALSPWLWKNYVANTTQQPAIANNQDSTQQDTQEDHTANASILPTTSPTDTEEVIDTTAVEEKVEEETTSDETEVVDKDTETYVVILGAFSKKRNATRLSKKLEKDKYKPVVDVSGSGLNRVGVEITCTPKEFKDHLQYIREHYTKSAWVVE